MDTFSVVSEQHDGRLVSRIRTIDANSEVVRRGGFVAPAYTFCIGVPPGGSVALSVAENSVRSVKVGHALRRTDADGHGAVAGGGWPWIVEQRPTRFGRLQALRCRLCPFVYDSVGGALRALEAARVVVRIDGESDYRCGHARSTHFDPVLRRVLINYEVARFWRSGGLPKALSTAQRAPCAVPAGGEALAFSVGDGHRGLNEGTTDENGLVRLSGADVAAVLGEGSAIDGIALLAGEKGELTRCRPEPLAGAPRRLVRIPLLRLDRDGDGRLDREDSFVAWVTGGSDWYFDSTASAFGYRLNRHDDYRRYWLVRDRNNALTMHKANLDERRAERTVDHFTDRLYVKRSRIVPGDGREATLDWAWEMLSETNPIGTYALPVVDPDPDSTGRLRVALETVKGSGEFSVRFGGRNVCLSCKPSQWYDVDCRQDPTVEVRYEGGDGTGSIEVEHVELEYSRRIDMAGRDRMTVFSTMGTGTVAYTLSGVPKSDRVYIVRVPDDEAGITLIDTVRTKAGVYRWVDSAGSGVRYHIATEAGFQPTPALEAYENANTSAYGVTDLRGGAECDYLIVYHDEFAEQADRLAAHKEHTGRFAEPRIVDIADVYREFSGGHRDPSALRNFIWHAKRCWPAGERLCYAVLMGLGHYDGRHIATAEQVFIPVNIEPNSDRTCAEQYFVGDSADMILGRLPCASAAEAEAIVDKIVAMERIGAADFGAWRNRMVLVADNDRKEHANSIESMGHYRQSETVANAVASRWPSVDIRKIYLFEYEMDESWRAPAAARALVSEINAGAGCVNYFGHGNEYVWAHESVFSVDDIAALHNDGRYPLITTFACGVGKFDVPDHDCLSGLLVRAREAGAIGVVSATRESSSGANGELALSMYTALFDRDSPISVGQAYAVARVENYGQSRQYAFLGDPSIRLASPSREIRVRIEDAGGRALDTLMALQTVTIRGDIREANGTRDRQFGNGASAAYVRLGLYNPAAVSRRKDGLTPDNKRYTMPGGPLFAAQVPVSGGVFSQQALIPRNVVFDKPGARLIAYAWQDTAVALGFDTSLVFLGTDTSAAGNADTVGPTIAVRLVSGDRGAEPAYTDALCGSLPMTCEIVVADRNGIDMLGSGPDEGLTVEIPGVLSKRSINHAFQFVGGDYREGTAAFVLSEGQMRPGTYRLAVGARDLLENYSRLVVDLEILEAAVLRLDHVFNYPNPMRMYETTRFYYAIPESPYMASAGLALRIYTLSGKLIRTVHQPANGYEWDGTDQLGNVLSPNVYLYQFTAWNNLTASEPVTSPIRRVVIHPPP